MRTISIVLFLALFVTAGIAAASEPVTAPTAAGQPEHSPEVQAPQEHPHGGHMSHPQCTHALCPHHALKHHSQDRAQDRAGQEFDTLVSGDLKHGGFVAAGLKYSRVLDDDMLLGTARLAWLLNHKFAIGLAGSMSFNNVEAPEAMQDPAFAQRYLSLGYGGLLLQCTMAPSKLVHFKVGTVIGGGHLSEMRMSHHRRSDPSDDDRLDRTRFLVAEPELEVELNIARNLRLSAAGGYRFVGKVTAVDVGVSDLRGPTGALYLTAGIF